MAAGNKNREVNEFEGRGSRDGTDRYWEKGGGSESETCGNVQRMSRQLTVKYSSASAARAPHVLNIPNIYIYISMRVVVCVVQYV